MNIIHCVLIICIGPGRIPGRRGPLVPCYPSRAHFRSPPPRSGGGDCRVRERRDDICLRIIVKLPREWTTNWAPVLCAHLDIWAAGVWTMKWLRRLPPPLGVENTPTRIQTRMRTACVKTRGSAASSFWRTSVAASATTPRSRSLP